MSKFETNAVTWFEIPTADFDRATNFYETVLDAKLLPYPGGEPCSIFPHQEGGVSGCIVQRPQPQALQPKAPSSTSTPTANSTPASSAPKNSALPSSSHAQKSPAASATSPASRTRRAITLACTATCSSSEATRMRRADRLFRIVQLLRSGRLKTARALAERLQVSERTIYRDVRDLQLAGQPIEGEAGVGYTLRREFDLPPLMFAPEELTALVLGARLVKAWGGAENAIAASNALARIEAVLPPELADSLDAILMYVPGFQMSQPCAACSIASTPPAPPAASSAFAYTRLNGEPSERTVRPLALYCWSGTWTLVSWCELRQDFRTFRLDRIAQLELLDRTFEQRRGQRLQDYLKRFKPSHAAPARLAAGESATPFLPPPASD